MSQNQTCSKLYRYIVVSILIAVGLGLWVTSFPTLAQQQTGSTAQETTATSSAASSASTSNQNNAVALGQISVVGTRIRSTAVAQPRPIEIMNAKQIEATGLTNVGQVLQQITSSGTATNARIDVGGNGETQLDMRNLGPNRVLILVNGKRWVTGLDGTVDLDQIPTSVIESIQVLKDGATAIYGSDAIAGVVNIITKKSFVGAQARAYLGQYNYGGKWDGQTQQFSYTMGYGGNQGNILFDVQYDQNDEITNCARPISCVPEYGTPVASGIGPQGQYIFFPPQGSSLYTNTALCPPNRQGQPRCDLTVIPGTLGNSIADFQRFTPADEFNYAQLYDLVAPNQSTNLYVQGSYSFNPNISFHSTAMYNHHVDIERYSPVNLVIGGGEQEGSLISATNPYNPFGFDLNGNITTPQPGQAALVEAVLRPIAGGFRRFTATDNTFYYNGGFDGSFGLGSRNFIWNADYVFGRSMDWTLTPTGEINLSRLATALGPVSNCGPGTPNPDCVPFAFFGSAQQTPAMFDYVRAQTQNTSDESLRDYEFNLSSGDLADLPGGPLGFNVGYEYRQLAGDTHPDSLQAIGAATDGGGQPTSGMYTVKSLYGELDVPLVANVPLIKEMDVDLAVRTSRFSTFGTNTTRQAGFKWQPDDQLLLRASWAQGFRAPNISELFSPQSLGDATLNDPCNATSLVTEPAQVAANCAAHGVPATYNQPITNEIDGDVLNGGNPNVQPETSESRSLGFVFNPDVLPGFNMNADYFKINVSNLISSFGALNILDACYVADIPNFCDLITRNAQGDITELVDTEINVGDISTSGIDVGASYAFNTSVGSFKLDFQSTFTRNYDLTIPNPLGGSTTYHEIGWAIGQNYQGFPKNKSNLSLNWNMGDWSALWRLRYISALIEDCTGYTQYGVCSDPNPDHLLYDGSGMVPTNHLGATTYDDASVSYSLDSINSVLTLGANNLFNKEPPVSYTAHNESFIPTIYDIPGRFVYFRITTKF